MQGLLHDDLVYLNEQRNRDRLDAASRSHRWRMRPALRRLWHRIADWTRQEPHDVPRAACPDRDLL